MLNEKSNFLHSTFHIDNSDVLNKEQLQARLKYLRANPQIPAVMIGAAGLVGVLSMLMTRRPKRDTVTDAITSGDFDSIVREAARQGYEAGYAAASTESAQRASTPTGISIFGMSPTEAISLIGLVVSVAQQAMAFVREQREKA